MKILNLIFKKTKVIYNGVTKDTRTKKEKAKDFNAKETLVASLPKQELFRNVNSLNEIRCGVVANQDGSGSCVEFAITKAIQMQLEKLGVSKQVISKIDYQLRSNRPQSGSYPQEMVERKRKLGWYWEKDVPSENLSDAQLDALQVAQGVLRENGYDLFYYVDWSPTWEETAQYINENWNACMLIDTDYNNYVKDFITPGKKGGGIRHEICGVDSVNYSGKEYIVFDESWGITSNTEIGQRGQRFMSKEAFRAGVEQVIFIRLSKKSENKIDYSKYTDLPYLEYGYRNKAVLKLQDMLKEANYMDKGSTINEDKYGNIYGYYGNSTKYAVLQWQLANIKSVSQAQLKAWEGKYWGNASNIRVKELATVAGDNPPAQEYMTTKIQFKWDKFLTITGSALLLYIATNINNIEWTKAGLLSAGTALIQFLAQAILKYLNEEKG